MGRYVLAYLPLRKLYLCVFFNDFLAVVMSASLANSVCKIILSAVRAFRHAGKLELPDVGTSFIASCFGYFSLRYCHFYLHLLKVLNNLFNIYFSKVLRTASLGSPCVFSHEQSPELRFFPHFGQSPRQSSLQSVFAGSTSRSSSSKGSERSIF